jgi:hypothetical protein
VTTDFESSVVLANTARALRTEVLPTLADPHARRTVVQLIAVIESHLAQLAGEETASSDQGLLMAFGGRVADRDDERA